MDRIRLQSLSQFAVFTMKQLGHEKKELRIYGNSTVYRKYMPELSNEQLGKLTI